MKITIEMSSIDDFEAWSGGEDTLEAVRKADKINELDEYANEIFPDGCTNTELNDWLWFSRDDIYDRLGLDENGEPLPDSLDNVSLEGYESEDNVNDLIEDYLESKYSSIVDYFDYDIVSADNGKVVVNIKDIEWHK